MAQKNYNLSICYIKAFAIMLMVLGHACSDNIPGFPLLMPFIVMFHMPIFFIASGYCFKEKYLSSPGKYLYNKVKGIWWPYVKWGLLFLLLHNVFSIYIFIMINMDIMEQRHVYIHYLTSPAMPLIL